MNETQLAWRVGIVVICAALILAILVFLFGEGWKSQYTVFVETETAPNVTINTPVRKNGILIGRVVEVENRDRSVMLTLKISSDESLYSNEVCRIGTASFLGDAVIEFMPGNNPNRGEALLDRTSVPTTNVSVERNPVEILDVALSLETQIQETLASIKLASDTVAEAGVGLNKLTGTVQESLGDENSEFKLFVKNARLLTERAGPAIDNFNEFMVHLNAYTGDPKARENIMLAISKLPELLDEINSTVADTRSTITSFQKVSKGAEENLANLTMFTEALGEQGPDLLDNLNNSLTKIDSLVTDFGSFAEGIGSSEGSLGKFLSDPELYDNLNATARNARDITSQLKPVLSQLEPLMLDVRYAVDGIARDPGQLGVRGALNRQQPFSGFKGSNGKQSYFR